jgi:hypothetical protein
LGDSAARRPRPASARPATTPLDPRLVFARTPAGSAEIVERRHALSPAARRILILVDGRRSLAELPALTRPGELPTVVADLQAAGLIALSGILDALPAGYLPATDPRLEALKARLRGAFERELGAAGTVLEARVQDCVNMLVMRRVLREVIDLVRDRAGEPAAQRVAVLARSPDDDR